MSGLITVVPEECSCWGGKASITDNGGVEFENVNELKLNEVFTRKFDNYVIYLSGGVAANAFIRAKMLDAGGNPNSSGYIDQYINYTDHFSYNRSGAKTNGWDFTNWVGNTNGTEMHLYGPHLPFPTVQRSVNVDRDRGGRMYENASVHNVAASWSGIQFATNTSTMSGKVIVMGYVK